MDSVVERTLRVVTGCLVVVTQVEKTQTTCQSRLHVKGNGGMSKESKVLPHELELPADVTSIKGAKEILRGWVTEERGIYVLDPDGFPEPAMWGMFLADIARHAASAISGKTGQSSGLLLSQITEMIRLELEAPTDVVSGRLETR